jgi:DDE superfamily endonuclease
MFNCDWPGQSRAHPRVKLHVVCDSYATHKTPAVNAWLAKHPRITLDFTPTSGSWLNMEIFFGIITRQAIRCGTFRSVNELTSAIGALIDACNQRCQPFTWTRDAGQILAKASSQTPQARGSSCSPGSAP